MNKSYEPNAGAQMRIRATYTSFDKILRFLEQLSLDNLKPLPPKHKILLLLVVLCYMGATVGIGQLDSMLQKTLILWWIFSLVSSLLFIFFSSKIDKVTKTFAAFFISVVLLPISLTAFNSFYTIPTNYNLIGFLSGLPLSYFILDFFSKLRIKAISPDIFRISYLKETYLCLFDPSEVKNKNGISFSAFSFEEQAEVDSLADRKSYTHLEPLFSCQWDLDEKSSLSLNHNHIKRMVIKDRKRKYKGTTHHDILQILVSSPKITTALTENLENKIRKNISGYPAKYNLKISEGKLKLSIQRLQRKSSLSDKNKDAVLDPTVMIPKGAIHQTLEILTNSLVKA
jgi:hypothetical protein